MEKRILQIFSTPLKTQKCLWLKERFIPCLHALKMQVFYLQMGRIYKWTTTQVLRLTETGKLFLKELDTTWSELQQAVNRVTSEKTKK